MIPSKYQLEQLEKIQYHFQEMSRIARELQYGNIQMCVRTSSSANLPIDNLRELYIEISLGD